MDFCEIFNKINFYNSTDQFQTVSILSEMKHSGNESIQNFEIYVTSKSRKCILINFLKNNRLTKNVIILLVFCETL